MKLSVAWLKSLISLPPSVDALVEALTRLGLEVDQIRPVAEPCTALMVGLVQSCEVLQEGWVRYEVQVGAKRMWQMATCEPGIELGEKYAVMPVGEKLGGKPVAPYEVQGQPMDGLFVRPKDLAMPEPWDQWLPCPMDAKVGQDAYVALGLDDVILEINVTPNRGDCLSMRGIARALAALFGQPFLETRSSTLPVMTKEWPVAVTAVGCPRFCTRIIKEIDNQAKTPLWLLHRLQRSGIRSVNPVVDVTNYVMLELGQPLHAYDAALLKGSLQVRLAKPGESISLLDGQTVSLQAEHMVVADEQQVVSLAGVMGSEATAVTHATTTVVLESAFFAPVAMADVARCYGLGTEASHRFERGIDPELQSLALERATALLLDMTAGLCGPIGEYVAPNDLPQPKLIMFRKSQATKLLGVEIPEAQIRVMFEHLGWPVLERAKGWDIRVPGYRFDIIQEVNLIAELAKLYGYDNMIAKPAQVPMQGSADHQLWPEVWTEILQARGYHECVTYSFVNSTRQKAMFPLQQGVDLVNPLSADMDQMQVSLWPNLLQALQLNQYRQQHQLRLFEQALCFEQGQPIKQYRCLSGIASGLYQPEQWGSPKRMVDFFDVKADMEALLAIMVESQRIAFVPAEHTMLHPKQAARLEIDQQTIGWLGALHPQWLQHLELQGPVYCFEIFLDHCPEPRVMLYQPLSKYPALRRDLSFFIDHPIPFEEVKRTIEALGCEFLQTVAIFDVYQGNQVPAGKKSFGLSLTLQHLSRTLKEKEIDAFVEQVTDKLKHDYQAIFRDQASSDAHQS